MSSFNRAFKRRKEVKKRKALKKGLQHVLNVTAGMPTSCTLCEEIFTQESDPSEWFMNIHEEKIILTCPDCSPKKDTIKP